MALIRTEVSESLIGGNVAGDQGGEGTERSCKLLYRHRLVGESAP
jgi:hypothetical protein